jgi:hypothetical protein
MTENECRSMLAATLARIARLELLILDQGKVCDQVSPEMTSKTSPSLRCKHRGSRTRAMLYDFNQATQRMKVLAEARRVRADAAETRLKLQHSKAQLREAVRMLARSSS